MDLILLSGESISNKDWIESVEKSIAGLFDETRILYYDHWQSGQPSIDFDHEFSKLPKLVEGLGEYAVFAKSIGAALAVRGISEGILTPKKCVFVGPAPHIKNWLENFSVPTLFITKTADPVAPAAALRDLLERYRVQNYQFIEIPGDNHKYEDLEKIKSLVVEFLKS